MICESDVQTQEGKTALDYAQEKNHPECAALLVSIPPVAATAKMQSHAHGGRDDSWSSNSGGGRSNSI